MKPPLKLILVLVAMTTRLMAEDLLPGGDFERDVVGSSPAGWSTFTPTATPSIIVRKGGPGDSTRCLIGRRSEFGGLVALARSFAHPQRRLEVEFSFAFSASAGRSLNIWSFDPKGLDASQLNLCIQGGSLQQFDGRTRSWRVVSLAVRSSPDLTRPVWHRMRVIVDANRPGVDIWLSKPGELHLPIKPTATHHAYRTHLALSGLALVSGRRVANGAWYVIDDLVVKSGNEVPPPHDVEPLQRPAVLWDGPRIPTDVEDIPLVPGFTHQTIHRATQDGYKFLHGAAIIEHKGVFYANWANSPTNENGPLETLQGRRSMDGCRTWSELEVIGPGFKGEERHSHGVLLKHRGELWAICSRFGIGTPGRRFPGLQAEAFVLNERSNRWVSRGIVMRNCWPYDQPVRMKNGCLITGGQDKDGLPVVAISQGDDLTQWDTVSLPYPPELAPSFAETTVWAEGEHVLAVIRGGAGVAWVSNSDDSGRTWTFAQMSNLPMPRAKAYLGKLSTGQLFLLSNLKSRDTLTISVGSPGKMTLSRMWRVRSGRSEPPRFRGAAKSKQWSYPYGYEHDGKLFVVYSIGKEDCGLTILPLKALMTSADSD